MENLVMNPQWQPGPEGKPMYYSHSGPIYDKFPFHGYRTCTVTRAENSAQPCFHTYDPPIVVEGNTVIAWGFQMRAMESKGVLMAADFYDEEGILLKESRQLVSHRIKHQFSPIFCCFPVPLRAHSVQLSIRFTGKVTACTYFAPAAYFL